MIISHFPGGAADKSKSPPAYTYTGESEVIGDEGGWKIRFLTSGTLKLEEVKIVDIFAVGGGGCGGRGNEQGNGGGGGGYTALAESIVLTAVDEYVITIGAGGICSSPNYDGGGGASSFGDFLIAKGGSAPIAYTGQGAGGSGGSGGGGMGYTSGHVAGAGGYDGSNGYSGTHAGGTGQGTTTREFHEITGTLYAGGGGGCAGSIYVGEGGAGGEGGGGKGGKKNSYAGESGEANTGGGGGGGIYNGVGAGNGGSGIVIIRNARGVA